MIEHVFATCDYEGSIAVWDVRTSVPLGVVKDHSGAAFCLTWAGPDWLLSGGKDGHVRSCTMTSAGLPKSDLG